MADSVEAGGSSRLAAVAVPTEHGGWSLTLEPVVLGLIVIPSVSGFALGAAALVGFLLRAVLRVVMVDRFRRRWLDRSRLAARVALVEGGILLALVGVALTTAEAPFWWPAGIAAPVVAVEFWFDMRSRSRRLLPELAGSIGVAAVAAMIVLAGGGSELRAVGAWATAAARAVAAIPFVRVQLRRIKSQSFRVGHSDMAQVVAVGIVVVALATGRSPGLVVAVIAAVGVAHAVLVRTTPPAVPILGAQQVVIGLVVVLVAGLGLARF